MHGIAFAAGSRLRSVLGSDRLDVTSLLHRAVEAIKHPNGPLIALQWHPERQTDSPCWATLASWMVEEARTSTAARTHEMTRAEVR